ncbi:MAG: hypothetical protein ACLUDK_09355 [Clostridium paraputrificum]
MKINNNYKIESDELNVIVKEKFIPQKGKKAGIPQWRPVSFHATVEQALNSIVDKEINGTGLEDFKTVVNKVKELRAFIKEVVVK